MRLFTPLLATVLLLAGCRAEPVIAIDLRILDSIPVVPLQISGSDESHSLRHSATGLLLGDGSVLTCSHALPRGVRGGGGGGGGALGRVRVTGPWINYDVKSRGTYRGDGSSWMDDAPPESLDDWAVITLDPPVDPAQFVQPTVAYHVSFEAPRVGETVYLVGYTVEPVEGSSEGAFIRYWVPLIVVSPPSNARSLGESVVWLRGPSEPFAQTQAPAYGGRPLASLRHGFSGGPVLRVRPGGLGGPTLEVCAILHGKALQRDDLGVAIVPKSFEHR